MWRDRGIACRLRVCVRGSLCTMLISGIALISYLRLSAIIDLRLSRLVTFTTTCKYYHRKRDGKRVCYMLCGGNLIMLFRGICFKRKERIPIENYSQDQISIETSSKSIAYADWLNDYRSAEEQYEYVKLQSFNDSRDPELLWRFGRACHCVYTYSNAAQEVKAAAIWDGLSVVERAVHIDSHNANVLVQLGRLTGCAAELCAYTSMIQSCKMAMKCRDHWKLATELDPSNHAAWFSLGVWNYNVLSRPFYERILFCKLMGFQPDLNEGIALMKKSNELLPHPLTSLYIGKCYLHINRKDEAKVWLKDSANFKCSPSISEETAYAYSKRVSLELMKELQ